jgi:peptide/nickel transport system substrate-binding protein
MKTLEQILQDSGIIIRPFWRSQYNHSIKAVRNNGAHPSDMNCDRIWLDS